MNICLRLILAVISAGLVLCGAADGANISRTSFQKQSQTYRKLWGVDFEWRFSKLPLSGMTPQERVPYAGYIYPDNYGGTANALAKYDRAFNRGRSRAGSFERQEIAETRENVRGPLGLLSWGKRTPHWAGHCNGWTAAAIRHAEPEKAVVARGVRFEPSDIKALLAELYTYCDHEMLGGGNGAPLNPGLLHLILANWVGRQEHPLGMDNSVGKEIWNFPIYAYTSSAAKRGPRSVEVKTNLGYVYMLEQGEMNDAPKNCQFLYLHYSLDLNSRGQVIGGHYYGDSNRLDMVWVPLKPTQGGQKGNERGNPYLDMETVLAMWKKSVPADTRDQWANIDPLAGERSAKITDQVATRSESGDEAETAPDNVADDEVAPVDTGEEEKPAVASEPVESDEDESPAAEVATGSGASLPNPPAEVR